MPFRNRPLVNGQIYHVINRGVAQSPIFLDKKDYVNCLNRLFYYRAKQKTRFSYLPRFKNQLHYTQPYNIVTKPFIEIIAYCFMPNHFHLLLRQATDDGISVFMNNYLDSYVRYFNTKHKRRGPLFEGRFKAIRIETDEQLLHVSRYIHLNPYSSFIVKTVDQVFSYPYSSLDQYLTNQDSKVIDKKVVLDFFKTPTLYKEFVKDQADYQQKLDLIKHLTLEVQ